MQNKSKIRILGVDPGYGRIGIAIIESDNKEQKLIHSECFETDSKLPQAERLSLIRARLLKMIKKFNPTKLATETLLWSKNKKTALKVSEARGVILSTASDSGLEIDEYNPNSIKLAVTGYGRSDKRQVIRMIEIIIKPNHKIKYDDEYDAIAVALTSAVSKNFAELSPKT